MSRFASLKALPKPSARRRAPSEPRPLPGKEEVLPQPSERTAARPSVRGKFIWVDGRKFYVRGVTYGTFRPNEQGEEFHDRARVERDFAQIAAQGINSIRTYTPPPVWMLDAALRHGLRVMVGLPWEQHIDFLADRATAAGIEARIRDAVRSYAGHPAVLCFTIGNEIPAVIVRWLGPRRVERFLRRLYDAVKKEDPEALVTYVNYPSTEYLRCPTDIVCFNVYLESQVTLDAYLARLQNIAGDLPLVMAEIGLDSRRNGEGMQARVVEWQVRTAFSAGCAGVFVFAWTDEWHRGGYGIEDWDFGLVDRQGRPKPALAAVREAFVDVPLPWTTPWPMFSIVICSHNGEKTIAESLAALGKLHYHNFEAIVVDDGSTDDTAAIARHYGARVISTPNRGLSSARNTGMAAARGDVIAYLDDDAYPDPHWLSYLAAAFLQTEHAAIGGPNLPPPNGGIVADAVASSPGGPIHVLYSDREAEHIPGCNFAIRKTVLEAMGGFDPQFRVAGDDVDLCWRLRERGFTIGFCPPAMVWHHRRDSISAYLKQQRGYGQAEAMLERKWPEKYNSAGHVIWAGRLYGASVARRVMTGRRRIRFGQWGTGLFQSVYEPTLGIVRSLPMMPEWYLLIGMLAALTALGAFWAPLQLSGLALATAIGLLGADAAISAAETNYATRLSIKERRRRRLLTFFLHLLQPGARLRGRITEGLSPWKRRGARRPHMPWPKTLTTWSEQWRSVEWRLMSLENALQWTGALVRRGGDFDSWDLEARGGLLGGVRVLMGIEEHGAGKQLVRVRVWPKISALGLGLAAFFLLLEIAALADGAFVAGLILAVAGSATVLRILLECGVAQRAAYEGVNGHSDRARRLA